MHDMAQIAAAAGVTDILHLGVYNCRTISGSSKLSQHGHANAIDIGGVRFEDGTVWTIVDDWEIGDASPVTEGGTWLQWLVEELFAKWIFNIVLTPEYDNNHYNHVHCDLSGGDRLLH